MYQRLHEFTEYETPDGEIYRFETGVDKFLISETGFGMPPVRYITSRSPTQHGETVIDYRLDPRVIQLVHRSNACSREEYWDKRATLLDMIRPNRSGIAQYALGTLRKKLPNGEVREIHVSIEQGPEFVARDPTRWDEWAFTEALRFVAHDPLFYDPVQKSVALSLATEGFVFPITLPLLIDDDIIDSTMTCTTLGTEDTYPTITITGPISGVEITNQSLGLELKVRYNVSRDEIVTVYLDPGNKRIISDQTGDITAAGYYTSDFGLFRLAPHPKVSGGQNVIHFYGSGLVSAGPTAIQMAWYDKYIGI